MTRKEYLEQKNCRPAAPVPETEPFQINSIDDYKKARKVLDEYEMQSITLTAEDFEAFDRNFETCIEDMTHTEDGDNEMSDVDNSILAMCATSWEWATSSVKGTDMRTPNADEFINCIRNLYEHLLEDPQPRMRACSAGFTIDLDIVDHMVSITWGYICVDHFDNELAK